MTDSISDSEYRIIYDEFILACAELQQVMIQMKEKCLKSYKGLEAAAVKNKSQVFKL
ncbi:hypothetical protein [Isorropodon fossajaponicum symbiont]|uniref:hypothetical protein n=1 Tax=Isorropodon fossajaponicum symbiont TaxID=883811 RepID=UPI00191560BE|nr:hypothetical protein [Isorropodon fossajaponicum symbiont]